MKLSLKSSGAAMSPADPLSGLSIAGRTHPVYRATALEQSDLRLSLRSGPPAEIIDIIVPDGSTVAKPVSTDLPVSGP
jgi:hypothetical protein